MKIQVKHASEKMLFNPYMLDLDRAGRADSEKYRCYMSLVAVIRGMLEDCGINIKCKGYLYIQDCIITIFDQKKLNIDFKNDVYPYVAYKHRVNDVTNIEHNIRNAIASAYKLYIENDIHSDVFSSFGRRPTNKEFLLYLTREAYIRLWREPVEFARY